MGGTNLSSSEISYPDLHRVPHFMECSTTKNGTEHRLVDISSIMDAKELALSFFFMLHRELLQITTTQRYCRVANLKVQRDYYKAMEVVLQRTQAREGDEDEGESMAPP